MESQNNSGEHVASVRRRGGKLREILTSDGRRFLVLKDPQTERFLEIGAALGPGDLDLLEGPLALAAGMALSYRMLSRRDRTEWEMRRALEEEGISRPEVCTQIVQALRRQGYLDDRRLASAFVSYTMDHKPSGPHLLRRKLKKLGVSEEIIDTEIGFVLTPEREMEAAAGLARQKLDGSVGRERTVRRIYQFLTRRGFSSGVINDICARILREGTIAEKDERER